MRSPIPFLLLVSLSFAILPRTITAAQADPGRLRVLVETDAGGDPDDEQSMVRFLLYANEWDVEGIIANRPVARDGENRNPERTGIGIVRRLVDAYGQCHPNLVQHDPRYPAVDRLLAVTVDGTETSDAGVRRIIAAVDSEDPRPLWYSDWGSDRGSATNNLRRVLDRVLRERGPEGYARFKGRIRLSSSDAFGPHTYGIQPPFALWVDTWRPEIDGRRWYHQFSRIVSPAGGFNPARDLLNGHGPLGALYPTNTGPKWKEGDSLSFIHWIPTGLGDPSDPTQGGWGGRLAPRTDAAGRPYYWASAVDRWNGVAHRDQTLVRWAEAIQNDFRARLDWCVRAVKEANHPPVVRLDGPMLRTVRPGQSVILSVAGSTDPDGQVLGFRWESYAEAGTGGEPPAWTDASTANVTWTAPSVREAVDFHLIASVTDAGEPPLTRYARVVVRVDPR